MRVAGVIAVLVASVFASAQDRSRGLDLRIQVGADMTRPNQSTLTTINGVDYKIQPDDQIAPQLRILGELPGAPGFYYQVGGRLESSSKMTFNQAINGKQIDTTDVEVAYSYFSFGGSYIWNSTNGLALGIHLEGRVERLKASGSFWEKDGSEPWKELKFESTAASYLRPWARLSLDYTFNNSSNVRPFIGVEGSYPITSRDQKHNWAIGEKQDSNLVESLAPKGSVAVYFGFRL